MRAFLADARDSTREARRARSTSSSAADEFVEHWTNKWADLLQVNRKFLGERGRRRRSATGSASRSPANTPYDQFARADPDRQRLEQENPAAAYYKILREPDGDDGEHHAPVPGRALQLQQVPRPPVRALDAGPVLPDGRVLRAGRARGRSGERRPQASAAPPSRAPSRSTRSSSTARTARSSTTAHRRSRRRRSSRTPCRTRRSAEARRAARSWPAWITSRTTRTSPKSYVNRVWGYLLGVGIIEPIDDIRAGNPPTNPELLDCLTEEFVAQRLRHAAPHPHDLQEPDVSALGRDEQVERGRQDQLLARHRAAAAGRGALRRDLCRLTGSKSKLPGVPAGTRAAALADSEVETAGRLPRNLGRPVRESACECERTASCSSARSWRSSAARPSATPSATRTTPSRSWSARPDDGPDRRTVPARPRTPRHRRRSQGRHRPPRHHRSAKHRPGREPAEYETEQQPVFARRELEHQARIEELKSEKAGYEKEIAPRLAELEKQRAEKIAAAQAAVGAADTALASKLAGLGGATEGQNRLGFRRSEGADVRRSTRQSSRSRPTVRSSSAGPTRNNRTPSSPAPTLASLTGLRLEALVRRPPRRQRPRPQRPGEFRPQRTRGVLAARART